MCPLWNRPAPCQGLWTAPCEGQRRFFEAKQTEEATGKQYVYISTIFLGGVNKSVRAPKPSGIQSELDWIGLHWVGLDYIGLDDCSNRARHPTRSLDRCALAITHHPPIIIIIIIVIFIINALRRISAHLGRLKSEDLA